MFVILRPLYYTHVRRVLLILEKHIIYFINTGSKQDFLLIPFSNEIIVSCERNI